MPDDEEEFPEDLRMKQHSLRCLDRRQARPQHDIREKHAAHPQHGAQQMQRLKSRENRHPLISNNSLSKARSSFAAIDRGVASVTPKPSAKAVAKPVRLPMVAVSTG